jgi:hypothetical protein
MLRDILMGTAAGACGTVALNVGTYLDMVVRGRPESQVPAKVAEKITAGVGVSLVPEAQAAPPEQRSELDQKGEYRKSGLGALMGYMTGLGVGTAYGVVRLLPINLPVPLAGVLLGAAAMASSDVPSVRLGVTDPAEWGTSGWLADILPHLAYGLVTALAYEAFTPRRVRRRGLIRR